MIDKQHFDVNQCDGPVLKAMGALVVTYVQGGYEGGLPAAISDFKKRLGGMGYSDQYIQDAAAVCERAGSKGWHKLHGR